VNGKPFSELADRLRLWAAGSPRLARLQRVRRGKPGQIAIFVIALLGALILFNIIQRAISPASTAKPSSVTGLVSQIKQGTIRQLDYDPNRLQLKVTPKKAASYTLGVPASQTANRLEQLAEQHKVVFASKALPAGGGLGSTLRTLLPQLLILCFLGFFLLRMTGNGGRRIAPSSSAVSFDDVAGCDEAVLELAEVRDFLADPARFATLGGRMPTGVLLSGLPGTGKTLLAKAVAHEAGVPFYSMSGSEFVEKFAGVGAKRVRSLFAQAKKTAPCIVFIDELDAIGRARTSGGDGGTREADQTLNQLLVEMDGFAAAHAPVIVMATSNRPEMLDPALVRPGRFDRQITIGAPDRQGRLAILQIHAAGKPLAADVDLARTARETAPMTGADLANLMNEAALIATRRRASEIAQVDIDAAYMRVVAGPAKNRRMDEPQRRKVAYHEAGHALVSEQFESAQKVHKISIIPRGDSGGQTVYVSAEDVYLLEREELDDRVCSLLAGRAAEELIFGRVSTGAADDLKKASEIVLRMVGEFGMGEEQGLLVRAEGKVELGSASEQEAKHLLSCQYARAQEILAESRDALARIAETLLEEETLDRERFLALLTRA